MEGRDLIRRNLRQVKILSWMLIVISFSFLLENFLIYREYYLTIWEMRSAGNYIPPRSTALNIYIITAGVKLILALIVFVSALFVLRFKNKWRMRLNYALTVTIILLIATPLINYFTMPDARIEAIARLGEATKIAAKNMFLIWSCFWSIVISSFFIYVIKKLSLGDIRLLFR